MIRRTYLSLASLVAAVGAATPAESASNGYLIRATVPTMCVVRPSFDPTQPQAATLGTIKEWCNAPGGYVVRMHYPAGTLVGRTISTGETAVQLDGSGTATIGRSHGARHREVAFRAEGARDPIKPASLWFEIEPLP